MPLCTYFALLQDDANDDKQKNLDSKNNCTYIQLTEQLLAAEGLPTLAELEEMLVSSHQFAQRIDQLIRLQPAIAAS